MDVYEELPDKIHSKIVKDLPTHIIERIRYQWRSSHFILDKVTHIPFSSNDPIIQDAITLSHQLSRNFINTILDNGIHIPQSYVQKLCKKCSVLQIPSLTCRSRIKHRSKKSNCNKKSKTASSAPKLKNQLIRTCLVCNYVTATDIGCIRQKVSRVSESANIPSPVSHPTPVTPKKFSFHDTLKQSSSRPASTIMKPAIDMNADFISLTSTSTGSISNSSDTVGNDGVGGKRFLTLLEREQLNKKMKKRRKSDSDAMIHDVNDDSKPSTPAAAPQPRVMPSVSSPAAVFANPSRIHKKQGKSSFSSNISMLTIQPASAPTTSLASLRSMFTSQNNP